MTAQWTDIDAITYIADGATNVPASHENKGVLSNQVPRKTGYDFLGWDEDPNVKNPTYKAGDPISKTGDVTLYAIWEKVVFNIIFDADGPDGDGGYFPTSNTTTITKTKPYGEAFVIDVEKPVRPGYIFADQWTHLNPKTGRVEPFDHNPNKTIYDIGDETTIDKVLYPVWTDATVDVTYDFNNNGANQKETVEVDISVSSSHTILSPSDLTNIDETYFKGWMFPDPNGAYWWAGTTEYGNAYDNGKVSIIMPGQNISLTGDLDLYAKWDYFIHYNDGTSFTHDAVRDGNNYALKEPAVSSAKMFNGWMLMETGEILQPGDTLTLTSDITLNAIWNGEVVETPDNPDAPVTYSIMYDWGDWVDGVVQTKKYDVKYHDTDYILSSEVPIYGNYIFKGWALGDDLHTPVYQPGDTYTDNADVVFYAVWEEPAVETYTITYDYNNGSGTTVTQEKAAGEDVVLSIYDPVYDGYTFLGWALGDDPDSVVYHTGDTYSEDADLYLYAVWEEEIDDDDGNEETEWYIVDEGMYGDNFEWSLDSYGVLSITGSGPLPEPYSLGYKLAPWETYSSLVIELDIGRGITSFYPHAFEGFSNLESIYLPTSVTSLAYRCFADCTSLTTLTLPAGLNYYYSPGSGTAYGAFQGDTAICDITIIGEGQLHSEGESYAPWRVGSDAGNEVTVKIGEGVTEFPAEAFRSCSKLVSVNIPSTVTTIGANAFNGCTGLTDVWYGSTMEKWNSISIGSGNTVLSSSGVTIHTISIDDFNGDGVTSDADALYILRYTILPVRYPLSVANADFDGNGIVDAKDAAWLKQRIN